MRGTAVRKSERASAHQHRAIYRNFGLLSTNRAVELNPKLVRCSLHAVALEPSISASRSPFGCRPSRIASTMSGAKQVSGRSRQTKATVTRSCSAKSVIDRACPLSILRRQRCARTSALIRVSSRPGFEVGIAAPCGVMISFRLPRRCSRIGMRMVSLSTSGLRRLWSRGLIVGQSEAWESQWQAALGRVKQFTASYRSHGR